MQFTFNTLRAFAVVNPLAMTSAEKIALITTVAGSLNLSPNAYVNTLRTLDRSDASNAAALRNARLCYRAYIA